MKPRILLTAGMATFWIIGCSPQIKGLGAAHLSNSVGLLPTLDVSSLEKFSVANAIVKTGSPSGNDCGKYLLADGFRWPTTFILSGRIYFALPCKYSDPGTGGWHLALASWDMVSSSAVGIDGNSSESGINEVINKTSIISGTTAVGNVVTSVFVAGAGNGLYGLFWWAAGKSPIHAADIASLAATDINISLVNPSNMSLADGSWQGGTGNDGDIYYENGTYYLYTHTTNVPTNTADFISVVTSPDMSNFTFPTEPLVQGYEFPYVSRDGGAYHMVAYNTVLEEWQYIPGSSPTQFNFSKAENLSMFSFLGAAAAWDHSFYYTLASSNPMVVGARALNGKLYIFYMAGDYDYPGAPPYNAPRGIGVIVGNLSE